LWTSYQANSNAGGRRRALIYGAGSAGELLARHVSANPSFPFSAIGFLDDDLNKRGKTIHGLKILGSGDEIVRLATKFNVEVILIAIHSAPGWVIRKIFDACKEAKVQPLIMPDMANVLGQDVIQPRPIDVGDLLRRAPASIDQVKIENFLRDRTILVTGAGGSIGSEISNQVAAKSVKKLVILDSSEFNLYKIDLSLREAFPSLEIVPILGSMTDQRLLDTVFSKHRPTCVLHAAAYKHVPLVEQNILTGITNNIYGTKLLAETAAKYGVERFVLISSDKAVRPTNVMGATKRVCELVIQCLHQIHKNKCHFCAVRFGNVLGSSGSVIPRFLDQIKSGSPLTVTHKEMTRFFMLTSEAVGLVLQSSAMSDGGEIFVLNMGEPVNIYEMARQLIMLSGKEPDKDVKIQITGIRPGEKLYEELILEGSETHTVHEDVFIARPDEFDVLETLSKIEKILELADQGKTADARAELFALITQPNSDETTIEPSQELVH
jgi:FlaA1/EpsC-like NDP-sugar epimerase